MEPEGRHKLHGRIPAYAEASAGKYPAERQEKSEAVFPTSSAKRDHINIYQRAKCNLSGTAANVAFTQLSPITLRKCLQIILTKRDTGLSTLFYQTGRNIYRELPETVFIFL